ncbi:Hypothetical predicted protein [Cloeon dipterum]|uniref:ATP-dependent RNA helicase n=1 Tax=Cloeon dipterum TaxID=197152 RepID=A0A8S1BRL1_9INSE|nr:Hypothetical predicted protein [Cloeon dipterum]
MKLFVVERYGANDAGIKDDSVQKQRLDSLLKKAQKRKETAENAIISEQQQEQEESVKKKKKRKSQVSESVEAEKPTEQEEQQKDDEDGLEQRKKATAEVSQDPEGFTVIGRDQFKRVKEVKGVAPKWLLHPTVISVNMKNLDANVDDVLDLAPVLKQTLKTENVQKMFPVQRDIIPWILKEFKFSLTGYWPRDLCVSAPTGSGKTLAFVLPLVQILLGRPLLEVKALVVLPVQDLAKQVFSVFQTYSKGTNVKVALAVGQGQIENEQRQLVRKDACGNFHSLAHIVVTTPGRLVHHLRVTEGLDFSKLRFLVVDEADRVMDSAQSDWLFHLEKHIAKSGSKRVLGQVPPLTIHTLETQAPPPQKLLFSATLSQDPEKLAKLALFQPKLFTSVVKAKNPTVDAENDEEDVGHFSMPAEIRERYVLCEEDGAKPLLLHCLLTKRAEKSQQKKGHGCKSLCFADSRVAAHRLCLLLQKLSESSETKLRVAEITAELRLMERNCILNRFTNGELDVIVSSDALARGIDIPSVDCVVSYDVPQQAKLHVHRVGRTGRAGRKGEAITVLSPQQLPSFQHMLRGVAKGNELKELKSPQDEMEALEETYKKALAEVRKCIKEEAKHKLVVKKKRTGVFKRNKTARRRSAKKLLKAKRK